MKNERCDFFPLSSANAAWFILHCFFTDVAFFCVSLADTEGQKGHFVHSMGCTQVTFCMAVEESDQEQNAEEMECGKCLQISWKQILQMILLRDNGCGFITFENLLLGRLYNDNKSREPNPAVIGWIDRHMIRRNQNKAQ